MSTLTRPLLALFSLAFLFPVSILADEPDPLDSVRERMKIEAQRLEKEFAEQRSEAYKLVRSSDTRPVEATEKLQTLLALVRNDTSLDPKRRAVLILTLKADLDRVQQIASERRRFAIRNDDAIRRSITESNQRASDTRTTATSRQVTDEVKSIIESRSRALADARSDRIRYGDRFNRVMRSVDESAVPESGNMTFPKNWVELSEKRSPGAKLTAKERAIMKVLGTAITVDFDKNTFEDVISYLKKVTGIEIIVDQRALAEVSVSYESPITLKLKASTRTILKRLLADLNLTYIIKDEAIQVTSRERANQMTTTRAYYIGDLAMIVDIRMPPELSQLAMAESVNRIIANITQNVDPQSWKVNNPDAAGAIVFDPITMTLIVKQTAEIHYMLSGYR